MIWFTIPTNVKIDLGLFPEVPRGKVAKKVFEDEACDLVRRSLNQLEYENPPETELAPTET